MIILYTKLYNIFTFSSWMRRYWFYVKNDSKFSSNLYVLRPPESEKMVFTKVFVSLSIRRLWITLNRIIGLSFGILYRRPKSKDEFINQPHPTKIVKIRAFFEFLKKNLLKKFKISILLSDSPHKSLLIILIIIFRLN